MNPLFTIAAISDIHVEKYSLEKGFFDAVNHHADLLIIGGDMNNGKEKEIKLFLDLISTVNIPIIIIFGNHDCDTDDLEKTKRLLLSHSKIKILDGDYAEYTFNEKVIGIAGTKGFGGGFAPYRMVGRGELATKSFLAEEEKEILKLQHALSFMTANNPQFRLVVTHWAAFEETIQGEPEELYIALGSSKMGDAIETVSPHLTLSGHAHHGTAGIKKARGRIPASNIAYPVNDQMISLFDFLPDMSISQRHIKSTEKIA